MQKIILTLMSLCILIAFSGCEKDNFDAPKSQLSGKLVFQSDYIGVKNSQTELELWQDGYELRAKIPVYIAQDGTYKAMLFNGLYKMVRLAGAPWETPSGDTVVINVKGNTIQDVPVIPFFVLRNVTAQKNGNAVTANFSVHKASTDATKTIEKVILCLSQTIIVDEQNRTTHDEAPELSAGDIIDGQTVTLTHELRGLASADYVFVRIGVKTNGISQLIYSEPIKVNLK